MSRFTCQADLQKYNFFFTQTWFEPKIVYPKKCVNYDKFDLQQNSVKSPKDTYSANKCERVTLSSKICQKMPPKSAKLCYNSLSQQNSVIFCKDFTPSRIFFTPTLLARWYIFASHFICHVSHVRC